MSRRPGLIKGAPTRTWDIYREWPTGIYHDGLHGESDGRKDIPWDTKGGQIGKAIEVPWRTRPGKSRSWGTGGFASLAGETVQIGDMG